MRRAGTVAIFLLALFFALFGCMVLLSIKNGEDLWAHGQPAEGTLVAHRSRKKSTMKEYTYTYRVGDREYTAENRDVEYGAASLPIGTRLEVRYDPANPERSITPAELAEQGKIGNRLVFFLISAAFGYWGWRRTVRRDQKGPPATSG